MCYKVEAIIKLHTDDAKRVYTLISANGEVLCQMSPRYSSHRLLGRLLGNNTAFIIICWLKMFDSATSLTILPTMGKQFPTIYSSNLTLSFLERRTSKKI